VPRPAVVLGLLPAGLAIARALGRSGISVSGIAFGAEFGSASRYLTQCRRLDEAGDEEERDERFVAMVEEASRKGRPVLFAELDLPVELILRNWEAIRDIADVPLPDDAELVRRLAAKDTLAEEADRAGIATPRTVVPQSEEDVRSAGLPKPFLVKPVASEAYARRFAHKLVRVHSDDEAVAAWSRAAAAGFATVLQEEIPAYDRVFSLLTYVSREGEPLASVVGRKLRQIPRRFGTATVFRVDFEPRVLELGQRLLASSGYRGFAHVELVHDGRDDSFRLLEVNTRPPVWCGIAMTAAWDIAGLAYGDLVGARPRPLGVLTRGATWIYGAKDGWVAAQMAVRGELRPGDALAPYRARPKVRAVLARDDPRPGVALARWAAELGARRAARRLARARLSLRPRR